jgi:hypothetical protein
VVGPSYADVVWPVLDPSDSCSEWEPEPAADLPEAGDPGPDLLLQMLQMQSSARDPEQPPPPTPPWRWAPSEPVASPSDPPPARPPDVVTFDDAPDSPPNP